MSFEGIEAIDHHLAEQICIWLHEDQESLLYYSILLLSYALRQGHLCLDLKQSAGFYWPRAEGPAYQFPDYVDWASYIRSFDTDLLVFEAPRLYFRRHWFFEDQIAFKLGQMMKKNNPFSLKDIRTVLDQIFAPDPKDEQRLAVANALIRRFSVIAGGPGTGKTYTVARLLLALQILSGQKLNIQLLAPTGKAAQRLTESLQQAKMKLAARFPDWIQSIPEQSSTLHRYLGAGRYNRFKYDAKHPLDVDLVLVDEASMLDIEITYRLLSALPDEVQLILIGDAHQLPPVDAGHLLANLCPWPHPGYSKEHRQKLIQLTDSTHALTQKQAADHVVYLYRNHRFDEQSDIARLSRAILNEPPDKYWPWLKKSTISVQSNQDWQSAVQSMAEKYRVFEQDDLEQAFARLNQFRILCAIREGPFGVEAINRQISHLLNPNASEYAHGRPVMVNKNYYHLRLFNGDIGLIWRDQSGLKAFFPKENGFQAYNISRIPDLEVVYAMTVHKTQGSEYDEVALILPDQPNPILSKELLYTAITRAKKKLSLWVEPEIWQYSIHNSYHRYSGLKNKLC